MSRSNRLFVSVALFLTAAPGVYAAPLTIAAPPGVAPLEVVADTGAPNPTDATYAGKIVFAKTAEAIGDTPVADQLVSQFNYSDPIHLKGFFARSFENEFRLLGVECKKFGFARIVDIDVDGVPVTTHPWGAFSQTYEFLKYETWNRTAFAPSGKDPINVRPRTDAYSLAREFYNNVTPTLTAGPHQIRFALNAVCTPANPTVKADYYKLPKPVAEGTITLTLSAADASAASKAGVQLPAAGMTDAKLTAKMTSIMKEQWPTDDVLKVVITGKQWATNKMRLKGKMIPVDRRLSTVVGTKQGTGKCKSFEVTFIQEADNLAGTKWKPLAYNSVGGNKEIACARLK